MNEIKSLKHDLDQWEINKQNWLNEKAELQKETLQVKKQLFDFMKKKQQVDL